MARYRRRRVGGSHDAVGGLPESGAGIGAADDNACYHHPNIAVDSAADDSATDDPAADDAAGRPD
jgi:hypothetical protein